MCCSVNPLLDVIFTLPPEGSWGRFDVIHMSGISGPSLISLMVSSPDFYEENSPVFLVKKKTSLFGYC